MLSVLRTIAVLAGLSGCWVAAGAIIGASSNVDIVAPPLSAGANLGGTGGNAVAWNEQTGVSVTQLPVDLHPGTWSGGPWFVWGPVTSHMLHFSNSAVSGGPAQQTGWVRFSGMIIGVIMYDPTLSNSDALLGSTGTVYPGGMLHRGVNGPMALSRVWLSTTSSLTDTLLFDLNPGGSGFGSTGYLFPSIDQVRVLIAVPGAGSVACFGVAGLTGLRRRRNG